MNNFILTIAIWWAASILEFKLMGKPKFMVFDDGHWIVLALIGAVVVIIPCVCPLLGTSSEPKQYFIKSQIFNLVMAGLLVGYSAVIYKTGGGAWLLAVPVLSAVAGVVLYKVVKWKCL